MTVVQFSNRPNDGYYEGNMFAGNGIDKCRVCGYPTRDHEMKPCPVMNMATIIGQPLPRVPNHSECHRTGCDNPIPQNNKRRSAGPRKKYCSRSCGQRHNAYLARGWSDENDQAYEEAR